jgi:hypothetical protein
MLIDMNGGEVKLWKGLHGMPNKMLPGELSSEALVKETPIERIDVTTFRVPGAGEMGPKAITEVEGVIPFRGDSALCVETEDES